MLLFVVQVTTELEPQKPKTQHRHRIKLSKIGTEKRNKFKAQDSISISSSRKTNPWMINRCKITETPQSISNENPAWKKDRELGKSRDITTRTGRRNRNWEYKDSVSKCSRRGKKMGTSGLSCKNYFLFPRNPQQTEIREKTTWKLEFLTHRVKRTAGKVPTSETGKLIEQGSVGWNAQSPLG